MSELITQLGLDPLLFGAQIVNFLLLLAILTKFIYKPLVTMLDKRADKIESSLKRAEEIEVETRQSQERLEQEIAKANKKAADILASAKSDAEVLRAELAEKAETQAADIIEKGKATLMQERDRLRTELAAEAKTLVADATAKILEEDIDDSRRAELEKKAATHLN